MDSLAQQHCVPCRGITAPLTRADIAPLHAQVPRWEVVDDGRLVRALAFRDFKAALEFVDRVGALAEEEGHHPDLHLSWGAVRVELWTHAIGGLSESDFVLAAKIDRIADAAPGRA